jgi:hypothetical protein
MPPQPTELHFLLICTLFIFFYFLFFFFGSLGQIGVSQHSVKRNGWNDLLDNNPKNKELLDKIKNYGAI